MKKSGVYGLFAKRDLLCDFFVKTGSSRRSSSANKENMRINIIQVCFMSDKSKRVYPKKFLIDNYLILKTCK